MELKGPLSVSSRKQNPKNNTDSESPVHEAFLGGGEDKGSLGKGGWVPFCYILVENLGAFCLCPFSLSEAKFKVNGLSQLIGELSIQRCTHVMIGYCSPLLDTPGVREWKYTKRITCSLVRERAWVLL